MVRERGRQERIGWIIDANVRAFVDSLDHDLVCEVLTPRVNDGAIRRLIRKWLRAGVLEGETLSYPERGSPQGGVLSPLRATLFLDHVWDEWFERDVMPRMKGRGVLLRLADDCVIGWAREDDARRILAVLPKRLARFQRTIHPQRTRLGRFQCQKLRGPYQSYGIRGNYRQLDARYRSVERAWRYWLSRRGGPRTIRGETFAKLCAVLPLPTPRIMHHI